jgi:tRNA modification GTPase
VHARFRDAAGEAMDQGIALFFRAPASFTGEDVLELQGHGGPVVLDMLLERVVALGARLALPGEFSQRAYLNDRLDLAQAEAIADLIDSQTTAAARAAARTLEGVFSERVNGLVSALVELRMHVEAAIDFPEEEIDFLADPQIANGLNELTARVDQLARSAHTGQVLRDGLNLVIAGPPNAGKSSLLNVLTGVESAIVTAIPGTTRDLLRERIEIDGMPVHLVDTAGLRDTADPVEREGVRRAREQIARADHALWVFDGSVDASGNGLDHAGLPEGLPVTLVHNKIDLSGTAPGTLVRDGMTEIRLSAVTGAGVSTLREHLKQLAGFEGTGSGDFSARRRHLDAIRRAAAALEAGRRALTQDRAGELLAEDLRQAQLALAEITGEFTSDDLLGEIFGRFCIGK